MIRIENLKISFDGQPVLKGIDLTIEDNETMVILGPSGQGKTVFIKTLVRLLEPDSGRIYFNGEDILQFKRKELQEFRKHIAFVFQNSALFDFLDVRENLSLFLRMHRNLTDLQIAPLIEEALRFVGLTPDVLDKFPEELSGGMRKRVAIARAYLKQPGCVFYDEPTTGLDQANAEKVSELIRLLQDKIHATSVVVTHDIQLMREVADRVALLKDGRICFVGKKSDMDEETLEQFYSGGVHHEL